MSSIVQDQRPGPGGATGGWRQALRNVWRENWGAATMGYLFILPALALYITFSAYPLIRGVMIAFSPGRHWAGVASCCVEVSCSESITRRTSSKLRPVVIG